VPERFQVLFAAFPSVRLAMRPVSASIGAEAAPYSTADSRTRDSCCSCTQARPSLGPISRHRPAGAPSPHEDLFTQPPLHATIRCVRRSKYAHYASTTPVEIRYRQVFKTTGVFGVLQLLCLALGAVKLVRYALETREWKLASPALLSGIRKQLDEGQIDQALLQAKSDSGYAGRVLAGALSRKSVGGDVRRGFEDTVALEYSRLRGRIDTLLGIGLVGFLAGPCGVVLGWWCHLQILQTLQSPTFADVTHNAFGCLELLWWGFIIALIFVPAFLVMKRRVSTNVSKVNVELGALLDRVALQK
jgi:hypothetical protein